MEESIARIYMKGKKPIFSDDFPNDDVSGVLIVFEKPQPAREVCKKMLRYNKEHILICPDYIERVLKVLCEGDTDANSK